MYRIFNAVKNVNLNSYVQSFSRHLHRWTLWILIIRTVTIILSKYRLCKWCRHKGTTTHHVFYNIQFWDRISKFTLLRQLFCIDEKNHTCSRRTKLRKLVHFLNINILFYWEVFFFFLSLIYFMSFSA